MAQRRFPIAVSDLAGWQDEARYLAKLPPPFEATSGGADVAAELDAAIKHHLDAAQARLSTTRWKFMLGTTLIGSVMAHMHAASILMLRRGDSDYLLGKLPKIQSDVRNHLDLKDPQRIAFELLMRDVDKLGTNVQAKLNFIDSGLVREEIITAGSAANMAYRREYARMLSFRRGLTAWTVILLLLSGGLALWGATNPSDLAICFTPEGKATVVCPTNESPLPSEQGTQTNGGAETEQQAQNVQSRDEVVAATVRPTDISLLLFVGMAGAAVSAAGSFRAVGGTAAPFNLAIAMALLKLPLGALISVFGLLLIRGGFFPGLSDLDSSQQILAWAVIFGAAQQLFTVMVDQQAKRVQDKVGQVLDSPAN